MKYKYFLRGFGTGVLFATLILMLALTINDNIPKKSNKNDDKVNSVGNVKVEQDSSEHEGDKFTEKENADIKATDKDESGTQSSDKQDETTKGKEQSVNTESTDNSESTKINGDESETTAQESTTQREATTQTQEAEMATFAIEGGMTSGEVSEILEEVGLIEDSGDFDKYMREKGYTAKLRVGEYSLPKGSTYEEIAEAIVW